MAKHGVFRDGHLTVNAYNLSDHTAEFSLTTSQAELPNHAMGDTTSYNAPGLHSWSVTARFFQDFASGKVHECLENMRNSKTVAPIVMRASSSAASLTNPAWSGSCFISSYRPVGGAHGDNLMVEVTFSAAGDLSVLTS